MKQNLLITNFILILLGVFSSCKTKQDGGKISTSSNWRSFSVETRFQKIIIENNSDSVYFENKIYKDGVGDIPPKYELDRIEKGNIFFSKSQKDSLIYYIKKTITNPTFTNTYATEYVGNVVFSLRTGNMKLMCQYSSVGDWTTVSNDTKRIYEIINKKIKLSTQ